MSLWNSCSLQSPVDIKLPLCSGPELKRCVSPLVYTFLLKQNCLASFQAPERKRKWPNVRKREKIRISTLKGLDSCVQKNFSFRRPQYTCVSYLWNSADFRFQVSEGLGQ